MIEPYRGRRSRESIGGLLLVSVITWSLLAVAVGCPVFGQMPYALQTLLGSTERGRELFTWMLLGFVCFGQEGTYFLAWFANPLWLAGWIALLLRKYFLSAWLATWAVLMPLNLWITVFLARDPLYEAARIFRAGYILWHAALFALCVGAVVLAVRHARKVFSDE